MLSISKLLCRLIMTCVGLCIMVTPKGACSKSRDSFSFLQISDISETVQIVTLLLQNTIRKWYVAYWVWITQFQMTLSDFQRNSPVTRFFKCNFPTIVQQLSTTTDPALHCREILTEKCLQSWHHQRRPNERNPIHDHRSVCYFYCRKRKTCFTLSSCFLLYNCHEGINYIRRLMCR